MCFSNNNNTIYFYLKNRMLFMRYNRTCVFSDPAGLLIFVEVIIISFINICSCIFVVQSYFKSLTELKPVYYA